MIREFKSFEPRILREVSFRESKTYEEEFKEIDVEAVSDIINTMNEISHE